MEGRTQYPVLSTQQEVRLQVITVIALVACVFGLASADSFGAAFAGGTGEPNNPYQIATAEQLILMGQDPNLLSRCFVLTADLDMDPSVSGGKVFTSVLIAPWAESPFMGSLDGRGHVIRNLHIACVVDAGLFGYVGPTGAVSNLGLEGVLVTGRWYAGGLAAHNEGSLSGCYSTGSVTGRDTLGGLLGKNNGTVTSSYSTCNVSGERDVVGGLVGWNQGPIVLCHSTGAVTGQVWVGGLIGQNYGPVSRSYATGDVKATHGMVGLVGGLVGDNSDMIRSCYATGSVTGERQVGGLVGYNSDFMSGVACCYSTGSVIAVDPVFFGQAGGLVGINMGTVSACYSTSKVAGWEAVGGLIGSNTNYTDQITASYFLSEWEGGGPDNGLGVALTAGQMRQQDSLAGFDFWGGAADGTADEWWMAAGELPVLVWQTDRTGLEPVPDVRGLKQEEAGKALAAAGLSLATEVQGDYDRTIPQGRILGTIPPSYAARGSAIVAVVSLGPYDWATNPGNGTEARPFQIQTASQLDGLMDHPAFWGSFFLLTADIDLAGRTYSTALIAPDSDGSKAGFQGTPFTGSLDGNGLKILNLNIETATNDYLGLFGFLAKDASVKKLNLVSSRIKGQEGSYYVGTVAGYNAGAITDCFASGAVSGHSGYVDDLVGGGPGTIENCTEAVSQMRWGGAPPAH
jgi:hypothetical protein